MRFVQGFLRQVLAGLAVLLALTVILGIGYPAAVWGISRIGSDSAEGSPLRDAQGCVVGSALIGVDPQVAPGEPDPFFHTRAGADPAAAVPSNLGPASEVLASAVEQRRAAIAARENVDPTAVPADAVTGSGSGVDPDISPAYAAIQAARVAQVNGVSLSDVEALVAEHTHGPQYGVLGAEAVNVPELNLALRDTYRPGEETGCGGQG
ncbi:Potassium-transporting ATPase C chain [Rhodococcus sp. AW25M09]|uniref:potassium-transporting ATPase subunit C n=1 Tax=Rhodococcus sp. AW25M09 TaxID=1268303 RepID=UPI0002ABAA50|nr:potassium-transporting ATPase subunit C [Rhodococcus sp. AW25M09]CCQ14007.1 Potassium-transporting ATPase C chain [Rhodococcus sp. AW25M09]